MPHRRKPFIDKKNATKYRLIPGYVPDHEDDPLSHTEEDVDKRKEEQRDYGIFYNDNYDYMQHLRSITEGATMVKESDLANAEEDLRSSYGGSVNTVNFRLFSTENVVKEERIDPDILASLDEAPEVKMTEDGDIEYTDGMDFLDDDFVGQAGGFEPKPEPSESVGRHLYDLEEQDVGSDFDDLSDAHSDFDDSESELDLEDDMPQVTGRGTVQDDIIEAQTALILKNFEEGLGFSRIAQQMDEDEGHATTEDYENLKELLMQEKWKADQLMTATDFLNNHADRPNFDYSKFANESEEQEEFEWKDAPPAKPQFDCVSILSLNSNKRNLPTDIIVPSSQKYRSKQSSMCDTESSVGLSRRQLEEEMRLSRKADKASTFRPTDETMEEKKERKKAIKEERKERRQEKKANQMVFSMEKQKMEKELATLSKSGKGIRLS